MAGRLVTYDATAQHYGTWIRGYDWTIYGCLTYSQLQTRKSADALLKRFFDNLRKRLGPSVSYFAALEGRLSGCGHSRIALHWHFVAASDQSEGMATIADGLWRIGNSKIEQYDPNKEGAYYVSKLAAHPNGHILFDNLESMDFRGPSDLVAAANTNPYVPEHLKGKTSGKYLVIR
jgi:hypothetical protein